MDDLQYPTEEMAIISFGSCSFKPCYKWMTFNTDGLETRPTSSGSFKPCYKWMTFNTSYQIKT